MKEVAQSTTEPLLQRRSEATHPRTSGSAKDTEEVRPRRRRVAAQTKKGRTSPRGATLAEAASNLPSMTVSRLLAATGTTLTAMPRQKSSKSKSGN